MGKNLINFDDKKKFKNRYFTSIKVHIFKCVNINNILISNKISSDDINSRYFIGYINDNSEIKPLHIRFFKKENTEKIMMVKLNGCSF